MKDEKNLIENKEISNPKRMLLKLLKLIFNKYDINRYCSIILGNEILIHGESPSIFNKHEYNFLINIFKTLLFCAMNDEQSVKKVKYFIFFNIFYIFCHKFYKLINFIKKL